LKGDKFTISEKSVKGAVYQIHLREKIWVAVIASNLDFGLCFLVKVLGKD
jgi:hypothetical protein